MLLTNIFLLYLQNDKDRRHEFASVALRKRFSYLAEPEPSKSVVFLQFVTSSINVESFVLNYIYCYYLQWLLYCSVGFYY